MYNSIEIEVFKDFHNIIVQKKDKFILDGNIDSLFENV
jgi:hypothetical protein